MIKDMTVGDMNKKMITLTDGKYSKGEDDTSEIKRIDHVDPFGATHVLTKVVDMQSVHTKIESI